MKLTSKLKKNWYVIALLIIFLMAFWIRLAPKAAFDDCLPEMVCLQALDPFWVYRMSDSLLSNNFHLMDNDPLKYYPLGWDPHIEFPSPFYIPAMLYVFVNLLFNLSFLEWVRIYPPFMGALFVIPAYFIGKEIHNKRTGLLTAFFIATTPSLLYRTSAGFIEKEPVAGLFLLLTISFFIRAIKKNSLLSGINAGLSLAIMASSWGGVQYVYYIISGFAFLLLIINRFPSSLLKAYLPTTSLGFLIPYLFSIGGYLTPRLITTTSLICFGVLFLIIMRMLVEKRGLVTKKNLKLFIPSLSIALIMFLIIGSMFSVTLSTFFISFKTIFDFGSTEKSVMASTVAENNPASWGDISNQLGSNYAASTIPALQPIIPIFNLWFFALSGFFLLAFLTLKSTEKLKKYSSYFIGVYLLFLILIWFGNPSKEVIIPLLGEFPIIFIFPLSYFIISLFSKKWEHIFLSFWIFSAFLGSFSRIRMIFLLGFPAAVVGAYFISTLIDLIKNSTFVKNIKTTDKKNLLSTTITFFIVLLVLVNLSAAYFFTSSIGQSFNKNWQDAMDYLKTETPEDSAILSWWDYGYWFQTAGERASLADGGNQNVTIDEIIAKHFISSDVESMIPFLEQYSVDYIVVDYTLIGKYSAMSKIGNQGREVNAFISLGNPQQLNQNNQTILVFNLGGQQIYVPLNQQGLTGHILVVSPSGEAYMRYLCTAEGIIDLAPPEDKPIIDNCIMFTEFGVFFPTKKEAATSIFARLYIWDGKNIPFVEKVFDNVEIKIYKVNI